MTKKSAARLARDKIAKEQQQQPIWDDLTKMFSDFATTLVRANKTTVELYSLPMVAENVPDPENTEIHIKGLERDVVAFSAELNTIYNGHKHKSGPATNDAEVTAAFKIYEHYVDWNNRYQAIILPTVIFLAEQAGLASQKISEGIQKENEQNPNVVTDVEVKEPTVQEIFTKTE